MLKRIYVMIDINEGELIVQIYGVHEYIMNEDSIVLEIRMDPITVERLIKKDRHS